MSTNERTQRRPTDTSLHCDWGVLDGELRMQNQFFIADGADAVMRSKASWNMFVPLDKITLAYKFLRMYASHKGDVDSAD